jgi:hypothetical protein
MNIIQLPRYDGGTPEERLQQIERSIFSLINEVNVVLLDLEQQIREKGDINGDV